MSEVKEQIKEFYNQNNQNAFQQLMKELAEKIANGKIEPLDAYNYFFKKCGKIFPKSSNQTLLKDDLMKNFSYIFKFGF